MLADILDQPVQPFPPVSPAAMGAALGATKILDPPVHTHPTLEATLALKVLAGGDSGLYRRFCADYLIATP
jgi:hypothetical protein